MKNKIGYILILIPVAVIIFILSYDSIWIIDCINYQYNFATGEKIQNIWDIFESQAVHYFTWNGRYVAHWLCQLFLSLLGRGMFSCMNVLMYISLILLIIRVATKGSVTPPRLFTTTLLVLFFCDTNYTPPFQIGYIWMAVFVLGWIYLFFNYASLERGWDIALFSISIIVGNAQEAINIGVGGALIIYALINLRRMTRTQWCMTVGFGIGGLFLCLAPGTMGRTQEMVTTPIYSIVSFFLNLRVTYIFLGILIYQLLKKRTTLRTFYTGNAFLINAIIVLVIFNFIIGVGGYRQLFGIELFCCILTIRLLHDHSFSHVILGILSVAIIYLYFVKYQEIKKADSSYKELLAKIIENPSGPIFIDFPKFNPYIHPTAIFKYGEYLNYALLSVRADCTGSLDPTPIPCYPTKVKELLAKEAENQYYEYLPGEFILLQSKEDPKDFTLRRLINILGFKLPLPPYNVVFESYSPLDTDAYRIMYIPELLPIIDNQAVFFE